MTTCSVEMSHLNASPSHRMALAMEKFPQLAGLPGAQDCERARSILVKRTLFSCDKITEEVEEEEPCPIEKDKARHFFLQSIESLRRCAQGRQ